MSNGRAPTIRNTQVMYRKLIMIAEIFSPSVLCRRRRWSEKTAATDSMKIIESMSYVVVDLSKQTRGK